MLRVRQRLGKYRIDRRLADGGFAAVFRAYDTIEGIHVALKVPHPHALRDGALAEFRKEVRLTARLDHPHILPIKNAAYVDNVFVIVSPLGLATLADRLGSRLSFKKALLYAEHMLEALAFAHRKRIIHCDVKPENLIIFPGDHLRLADFGIAKVALRTLSASGSGTVGYLAPEQAMGKPSLRSDVFSAGLIMYRMLAGILPEWPYEWPGPGFDRLKRSAHPDLIALLRKSLELDERKRFADARQMLTTFKRLRARAEQTATKRKRKKKRGQRRRDWKQLRLKEFKRRYGKSLQATDKCGRCGGPMSEAMRTCPWCGNSKTIHRGPTQYPVRCRRCRRGMKLDWRFCPYCYGASLGPRSNRSYTDVRYQARCHKTNCKGDLMPFMRYCPWCRSKVRKKWKIPKMNEKCRHCGWGVLRDYWGDCPWCGKKLGRRRTG